VVAATAAACQAAQLHYVWRDNRDSPDGCKRHYAAGAASLLSFWALAAAIEGEDHCLFSIGLSVLLAYLRRRRYRHYYSNNEMLLLMLMMMMMKVTLVMLLLLERSKHHVASCVNRFRVQ